MTAVPSESALRRLARFRSAREGVLSLYLSFDPASGERRDALGAAYGTLEALGHRPMADKSRQRFEEERQRVLRFIAEEFELRGRSLAIFSCEPRGLWEVFELQTHVQTRARFSERPAVAQLAAILDEQERFGVVLFDKEQARIYSVYLDRIEDRVDIRDEYPGRTSMGGWSQARYSGHREAHLHRHVLHTIRSLERETRRRRFERLIVGGPEEALAALLVALPRGLRSRVVGTFSAELFVSDEELLERVRTLETAAERQAEELLVNDLIEAAKGGGPAVLGWDQTLPALGEGRVHKLVLVRGAGPRAKACPEGHFAALRPTGSCPVCGSCLEKVQDAAEWAIQAAFDKDAVFEVVEGEIAERLREEQGIGAVLRY